MIKVQLALTAVLLMMAGATPALAQQSVDLSMAGLEDLMNVEVTSVSKKEQQLFRTPAAVYVLTGERIRRSGVTSVPDALRLVPGLHVAQIDGNKWAVSVRGFSAFFANKLLVLVDGRVVYSPVISGTYWDLQDMFLEDIERIEVIRGPGSAVWGANAVNGVINIISKSAQLTTGGLASISAGSLERGTTAVRYGSRLGTAGYVRLFARRMDRRQMADETGGPGQDQSQMSQVGFRLDLTPSTADTITVQSSTLDGRSGQRHFKNLQSYAPSTQAVVADVSPARSSSVLAQWTRARSRQSSLSVKVFWDRSYRYVVGKGEATRTFDIELQQRVPVARRHDVVWGVGQRFWSDVEGRAFGEYLDPTSSRIRLFSAFVQDEITVVPGKFNLTLGTKFEHSTVNGFEPQPTARAAWFPTARQTVWGAYSRAVRTPSRIDRALRVDYAAFPGQNGQLVVLGLRGNPAAKNEHAVAFEAGYRIQLRAGLSLDATAFVNEYRHLRTENAGSSFQPLPVPHVEIVRQWVSTMTGRSSGGELLAHYQPLKAWRLEATYSLLRTRFRNVGTSVEATTYARRDPTHQWLVSSQLELPHGGEADVTLAYVGRLKSIDVPGHTRLNVRLGADVVSGLTVSLVGENLLHATQQEFAGAEGILIGRVRRSAHAQVTWHF